MNKSDKRVEVTFPCVTGQRNKDGSLLLSFRLVMTDEHFDALLGDVERACDLCHRRTTFMEHLRPGDDGVLTAAHRICHRCWPPAAVALVFKRCPQIIKFMLRLEVPGLHVKDRSDGRRYPLSSIACRWGAPSNNEARLEPPRQRSCSMKNGQVYCGL